MGLHLILGGVRAARTPTRPCKPKRGRRLFLARDRFGEKPPYVARPGGRPVFASELRALVRHRRVEARVSTLSMQKYFA